MIADRELRLRQRIDQLTDERDIARAVAASNWERIDKLTRAARGAQTSRDVWKRRAIAAEHELNPDRPIPSAVKPFMLRDLERSRDSWKARALAAEEMLKRIYDARRRQRGHARPEAAAS